MNSANISESGKLERLIGRLAPRWGLKRDQARLQLLQTRLALQVALRYEASTTGRRTKNWRTASSSANAEIGSSLGRARDRSRALVRDNGWAKKAINAIESNTVGPGGIRPAPRTELARKALELWKEWAETVLCDSDGMMDFYGIQGMALRGTAEGGDMLIRRRIRRSDDGLPVPLQLQVLEGDFLDERQDDTILHRSDANNRFKVQGVEFDRLGRRVGYHVYRSHPGDGLGMPESRFVEAEDVIHMLRMERAGQVRGIPWGAAIFLRLRDLDETTDAAILRQKIANCLTAFIKRSDESGAGVGTSKTEIPDKISPGAIEILAPGDDLEILQPPTAGDFPAFAYFTLHEIAAGFDLSFEVLTGNHAEVNFHSGRLGWIEFHNSVKKWRSRILVPHLCHRVWGWFIEAAQSVGRLPAAPMREFAVEWIPPRREMYDPVREGNARKTSVRMGVTSLSELIREDGRDPDQVFEALAEDVKRLEGLDLLSDAVPGMDANRTKAALNNTEDLNLQQTARQIKEMLAELRLLMADR